jgi:anti-sigma B factor antagonist
MAELEDQGATGSVEILQEELGILVVRVSGEVDLANADSLGATIEPVVSTRPEQLIVDVSDLEFMDSSGIALLLHWARGAGSVRLRNPSLIIRRTVETMGLADILHLEP